MIEKLYGISQGEEFSGILNQPLEFDVKDSGSKETNKVIQDLKDNHLVKAPYRDRELLVFHGLEFDLSKKYIFINDVLLINHDEVIKGDKKLYISSKNKRIKVKYVNQFDSET